MAGSSESVPDVLGMNGNVLMSKFRACLVGGVLGDCLGAHFEGRRSPSLDRLRKVSETPPENGMLHKYTDDTAMARSVAQSLLANDAFNGKDMANRFAQEYSKHPRRGYGGNIAHVFRDLGSEKYGDDVFRSAQLQFDGSGSYGNGGAMRTAPVALFAADDYSEMVSIARKTAQLTHANPAGYNGAILLCLAIHEVLWRSPPNLNRLQFLDNLITKMKLVETDTEEQPFVGRLKKAKLLLEAPQCTRVMVRNELGCGVAAIDSVATAIFSFLHCLQPLDELQELKINSLRPFQRTILYAISLGGDTDTIASMAANVSGAFFGMDDVPSWWQNTCEGAKDAVDHADGLFCACHARSVKSKEST